MPERRRSRSLRLLMGHLFMPIHLWSSICHALCFGLARLWDTPNPRPFRFLSPAFFDQPFLYYLSSLELCLLRSLGIFAQAACIPLAMAGRDICGSAITGSGKVYLVYEY